MESIIKAWCPRDGDQSLPAPEFALRTFSVRGQDYYEFTCPVCRLTYQKHADAYVVGLLRSGRVPETFTVVPDEMADPARDWLLPLTPDDLLDFHLAAQLENFLAEGL